MDTNKGLLKHRAEQYAKQRNVDNSTLDWESIIDTSLTDGENWGKIKEEVEKRMDSEDRLEEKSENISEEEIQAKEREVQEKYIEEIEKDKEQDLQLQFEDDAHEEVQKFYNMFNYYIKSICRDHHQSFMVNAEPGIGKSYQTNQTLINEVGNEKFEKSPAVASPFQFYKQLWELEQSDNEILVLDDIEGLLRSKKALAILKQATWSETDERYVGWNSSPSKLKNKEGQDIPEEFKFTGKLIMIFNEVPEDDIIFDSLKDRCFYYELSFSYEQKCKLIKAIADKGMDYGVSEKQRKEMASWLVDVTTPATNGLNLRTFELALKHYKANQDISEEGVNWKKVVKESLNVNENLEVARDIIKNSGHTKAGDRQDEFKERTGKTARTYRNARNKLKENSDEISQILN